MKKIGNIKEGVLFSSTMEGDQERDICLKPVKMRQSFKLSKWPKLIV